MGQTSPRGMPQVSPRGMGQTMSAFKPAATMTAASMAVAVPAAAAAAASSMLSPRPAADMTATMMSTMPRDSRAKFLKWFNSLSPRQGQVEEQELPQLELSRHVSLEHFLHQRTDCMLHQSKDNQHNAGVHFSLQPSIWLWQDRHSEMSRQISFQTLLTWTE